MSGEGFGGLAGAAAAELHLKMSKKIAQLTKVIFHLNTRNEDFQSEFVHAKRTHALELQQLTQDAAAKLRQLHEQLQAQTTAVQHAERQAAHDRQQFQKEFAQYEQQMQAKQSAAAQSFEQRVGQLEEQVEASCRTFSERAQQLVLLAETQQQLASRSSSVATAALQSAHASELEALKQQQNDEVTQLVTASNAKYNVMLAEQLRAQDALRDELAVSRAALEQQLAHAMSEHASAVAAQERTARESVEKVKHDLVSKIEALLADAEVLRGHERKLRDDKEALLQTQSEQQRRLQALELQVTKAQHEVQSVRQDADANAQRLQQMLSAGTDKIDELAQELETLRKTLQSRDQALRQAQRDLEAAQLETLQRSASLSEKDALLRQQMHERELQLATLRAEAQASNQQRALAEAGLQKKLEVLEAQVADRSKELATARAALTTSEQQRTQLQAQTDRDLRELRAASDESDRRALELVRAHDAQRSELTAEHERALQQLTLESEAKLRELENQLRHSTGESLAQATAQLKSEHTAALSEQKRVLEAVQRALQQELAGIATQLKVLQSETIVKDQELATLRKSTSELAAQLKREQDQRAALQCEKDAQLKAGERARKEREDALAKQMRDLVAQRESVVKTLSAEKQQLQLQHSQTLVALAREHELKQRTLRGEWDAEREALVAELTVHLEQQLAVLQDELCGLQSELARSASDAQESQRALRETRQLERESFRSETQRYVSSLAAQHVREQEVQAQRLCEMMTHHARELEQLAARLNGEHLQQLSNAQTRSEHHIAQLETRHRDELEQRSQQHAVATTTLREYLDTVHRGELETLRLANAQQVRELAAQKDRERALALQAAQTRNDVALGALQTHTDALQSALALRTAELATSVHECERLHGVTEATAKEMAERVAALERASREQVETLKRAAKQDMDRLLEENLAETKLLSEQFEETRRLMADKVVFLKQTIAEWEDRYARRESRLEDVSRIAALERVVAEKDALVRQTLDEMVYFKRELLNREEMYNKTFARAPNVGVMNVLKPHVQLQAQMQMQMQGVGGGGNNSSSNGSGSGSAPQMKRKTKPATSGVGAAAVVAFGGSGPETGGGELQRRNSERTPSSGVSGVKKSLPPLTNNQVAL